MMRDRLGTLDALRGLAALAVVVLHMEKVHLSGPILPHAFLAVDFFFALSGFVIAYTYEAKLSGGLSSGAFLVRRAIRLYPMIFLGVCFGTVVICLKLLTDPSHIDPPALILPGVLANLLVLPTPYASQASRGFLYLIDPPLWSVAFEIFVNVVWCIALVRASTRGLAIVVALCFACIVLAAWPHGTTDIGFDWTTLSGGFARVGFGFGLGLLVYRLRGRLVLVRGVAPKLASVVLLIGLFAVPRLGAFELVVDLAGVALLVPLVLLLALNSADHPRLDSALGDASYPLYAIHFPILSLASGVHLKMPQLNLGVLLLVTAIFMALATILVTRLYDEPARGALAGWWASRRQTAKPLSVDAAPKTAC